MNRIFAIWRGIRLRGIGTFVLAVFCLAGTVACHDKGNVDTDKLPFDAEFEISQSTCEGERCSGWSMRVHGDGTFDLISSKCESSELCSGKLSEEEVKKLFQTIDKFGFKSFSAMPMKCEKNVIPQAGTFMHLQMDGNEYDVNHGALCPTSPYDARLAQFEADIGVILAIDQRAIRQSIDQHGTKQATFADIDSCKPGRYLKKTANEEVPSATVGLKFEVGADGRLISAAIGKSSGYQRLDRLTLMALSRCRFKPGYRDGQAIVSTFTTDYVWAPE